MAGNTYRSLVPLTKWVVIFIWIQVALQPLLIAYYSYSLYLRWRVMQGNMAFFVALYRFTNLTGWKLIIIIPASIVELVTAVLVLRWFYRANKNLHARSVPGLDFTPGWAVGWFFVPVINLWKPYQVMRELFWASSDYSSAEKPRPRAFYLWFGCYFVSTISTWLSLRIIFGRNDGAARVLSDAVDVLTGFTGIAEALALLWLIREITQAQERGSGKHAAEVF